MESKKELKVHSKLIHSNTGIGPYECDFCQKTFRLKCFLKVHIQIHIKFRAFECHQCKNKKFRTKPELDVHMTFGKTFVSMQLMPKILQDK